MLHRQRFGIDVAAGCDALPETGPEKAVCGLVPERITRAVTIHSEDRKGYSVLFWVLSHKDEVSPNRCLSWCRPEHNKAQEVPSVSREMPVVHADRHIAETTAPR